MQSDAPSLSPEPSAALLKAQARLLQLRAQLGIEVKDSPPRSRSAARRPEPVNWARLNAEAELKQRREQAAIQLGRDYVSAPVASGHDDKGLPEIVDNATISRHIDGESRSRTVIVHPSLAVAVLKKNLEAPARVYFLLRAIDQDGRGWLSVEQIRQQLSRKDGAYRICGWRRLRQLLRQGEGFFWHRDGQDRLWISGVHKIAHELNLDRLQGFPVDLPVQTLLGGIQAVRAAFYAAFHGGRDSRPISRETLGDLTGIPERTQLEYDRAAGIERRRNYAVGESYTVEINQERAWRHGRAVFRFVDKRGRQGRAGGEYVAWNLPNSYRSGHQRRSRGGRKRINRKLADLLKRGIAGNDERVVEKLFFPNGALAVRRYNRDPECDAYWQREQTTRSGKRIWCVIPGNR
jgi:hypothetical protein